MSDADKPFGTIWQIILYGLAVANDTIEIVLIMIQFTGVGLVDEGLMQPIDLVFDAIFTSIFFSKLGWGGPSILQTIGVLTESIDIPTRMAFTYLGIKMANDPNSLIAKGVKVAAKLEGGGAAEATGGLEETANVAQKTEGAVKEGTQGIKTTEENTQNIKGSAVSKDNGSSSSGEQENQQKNSASSEDISATRDEGDPMENTAEDLNQGNLNPTESFSAQDQEHTMRLRNRSTRRVRDIDRPSRDSRTSSENRGNQAAQEG